MRTPEELRNELKSCDAITSAVETAAQKNGTSPLLDVAVALLENDEVCRQTGLAKALRQLASTSPPPSDPTTWLCARLREFRPALVAKNQGESVLEGLVMKCDEFANIHLLPTKQLHPQTWNFRKCDDADLPVFGVGQCHLDGISFLLKHLKDDLGFKAVKWFNMREEPVVFLDGQACAPRTAGNMNENVEYLVSIEGYELDSMELRLCSDCVDFAEKTDSKTIGVFYQTSNGDNEERQLATPIDRSYSIRNGYKWLAAQEGGASVEYYRVPIADETAPEEKDFDQLIAELRGNLAQPGVAFVFNCQMGRGRTTTGMVSACIMAKASRNFCDEAPLHEASTPRNRKRGEFLSILTLLDLIDRACSCSGQQAKLLADQSIDACAHAQNMVEAIVACENSAASAEPGAARSPEFWQSRAHNYLERYAYIILFAAYALENAASDYSSNFTEWSHQHWQFKRVIKHLTLE